MYPIVPKLQHFKPHVIFKHVLYLLASAYSTNNPINQCTCIECIFDGSDGKASIYNAGDLGSVPGLGRSPGEGNGNPLQYYCLEKPTDIGALQATVHGVVKSRTRLSDFTFFLFIPRTVLCARKLLFLLIYSLNIYDHVFWVKHCGKCCKRRTRHMI